MTWFHGLLFQSKYKLLFFIAVTFGGVSEGGEVRFQDKFTATGWSGWRPSLGDDFQQRSVQTGPRFPNPSSHLLNRSMYKK